jgi:hypothetical protein
MPSDKDIERFEQNFRDIFHKLNRLLPVSAFIATMVVIVGFWGSIFGLMYVDLQSHKTIANDQRIEVIRELGEVKTMIANIKQ